MKKTKSRIRPPRPERLPGTIKYRAPKGQKGDRPLERIRRGFSPVKPSS